MLGLPVITCCKQGIAKAVLNQGIVSCGNMLSWAKEQKAASGLYGTHGAFVKQDRICLCSADGFFFFIDKQFCDLRTHRQIKEKRYLFFFLLI